MSERDWIDARRGADFVVLARFTSASNATLLVTFEEGDTTDFDEDRLATLVNDPDDPRTLQLGVFKPQRGEAPLTDFPHGTLHRREVAAFEVSDRFGWDLVPATMLTHHASLGEGSVQRFVPHLGDEHYFHLRQRSAEDVVRQLQAMIAFDAIVNNADRKAGHVLWEHLPADRHSKRQNPSISASTADPADAAASHGGGRVRLVDHGLTFNVEHKLRTVAWDFAGQPLPPWLADIVHSMALHAGELEAMLTDLLTAKEVRRLVERADQLATVCRFPEPSGARPVPWPPV